MALIEEAISPHALYMREYRKRNPNRSAESRKRYLSHKEKILEQTKEWAKRNPEKRKKIRDAWDERNPERSRESKRAWEGRNKHKLTARVAKRHADKLKATPCWSNLKEIQLEYQLAKWCTEMMGEEYHVDHIIPLRGKHVCGLHVAHNLQVIPAKENRRKSNKLIEGHYP